MVQVAAANAAQFRYLEAHCKPAFTEAAQAVTGRLVSVTFKAPDAVDALSDGTPADPSEPTGLTLLNPDFTLDAFVPGPGNQVAGSAAAAVAGQPGLVYNPFLVYGARGTGKTHLLQGIVRAVANRSTSAQCRYVPCRMFIDDAIRDLEDGRARELRERYERVALLAVDDVHLLAGRGRSQEAFFHVLNTLLASQGQIVLSADRLPSEIPDLEARLATRMTAGLATALDVPCLETRMAILRNKARLLGIDLPEEVVRLIAERFDANVRELADALVRVDTLSEFESSPITPELTVRALQLDLSAHRTKSKQDHAVN
jgi:chromosomal replication initiator protein